MRVVSDAQIGQDLLENGVGERHVTTTGIGPAGVEALWCHENGAVLRDPRRLSAHVRSR